MRARAIILAIMTLAAFSAAPVRAQNDPAVLHAFGIYNSVAPFFAPYEDEDSPLRYTGARYFARCVLPIGDMVCISLWTLKVESFWPVQGLTVFNRTDKNIRLRLEGCEIHNGPQTIVIDGGYLYDSRKPTPPVAPIDDVIEAHDQMTPGLRNPENPESDTIPGMHSFQDGVRLTCRVATATPVP